MKNKNYFKRILSLICALALIITIINVPAFETKAATGTVTNLKWAKTVKKKSTYEVTWTWDPYPGATGYKIMAVDGFKNVLADAIITDTSFTIKTKKASYKIAFGVYVVDAVGISSDLAAVFGCTYPAAPNTITIWGWKQGTGNPTVRWYGFDKKITYALDEYDIPSGYEVKTTTLDGKNKKVYKMKTNCSHDTSLLDAYLENFSKNVKGCKNAGFKISIRSYRVGPNGKKMYSKWSKAKAFVPAAQITKAVRTRNGGKAYWKPIKNATGYSIYKRDPSTNKLLKIKSVGSRINSVELPTNCFYDGIVITANVKVNGKTYKSTYLKQVNKFYNYYY